MPSFAKGQICLSNNSLDYQMKSKKRKDSKAKTGEGYGKNDKTGDLQFDEASIPLARLRLKPTSGGVYNFVAYAKRC